MNQKQEFSWWIKVLTNKPMYVYYFGLFDNYYEAEWHKNGYIQDLCQEGSHLIDIQINQCQPEELTIAVKAMSV